MLAARRVGLTGLIVWAGCGGGASPARDVDAAPGLASDAARGAPDGPGAPGTPDAPPGGSWRRHTIATGVSGPAYAAVARVGGARAIVISSFGHPTTSLSGGAVTAYLPGASLDAWTASPIVTTADGVIFPNQPTVADVDGDGDDDVLVPSGFLVCAIPFLGNSGPCGAIAWYEQGAAGWTRHALLTKQDAFYHHVELADLDGDHVPDLVTDGETVPFGGTATAAVQWLRGTAGGDRFESTPRTIAAGGGSFPRLVDLDGDHDLDLASAQYFVHDASFVWFERAGDTWTRHVIDAQSGPAIDLVFVDDLTGDGTRKAIGTNHVNTAKSPPDPEDSAVLLFDVPADPTAPWPRRVISDGIVSRPGSAMAPLGAPGIFGVGDLDGDGDLDVAVSGDGDPHVYWLEQTAPGQFATHVVDDGLGQAGGMLITDVDGDGRNELIVTGYEADAVYVYART